MTAKERTDLFVFLSLLSFFSYVRLPRFRLDRVVFVIFVGFASLASQPKGSIPEGGRGAYGDLSRPSPTPPLLLPFSLDSFS